MRNSIVKKIIEKFVVEESNNDYLSYSALHKAFNITDTNIKDSSIRIAICDKVANLVAVAYFRGYFTKDDLEDGRGSCDFGVNSISREISFIEDFVGTENVENFVNDFIGS